VSALSFPFPKVWDCFIAEFQWVFLSLFISKKMATPLKVHLLRWSNTLASFVLTCDFLNVMQQFKKPLEHKMSLADTARPQETRKQAVARDLGFGTTSGRMYQSSVSYSDVYRRC
jgi:hypothetical protein